MIARFPQPVGSGQTDSFGRFFLQRLLGRGGATSVYVAHDPSLGKDVALKLLVSGNSELQERFLLEARDAMRLRHPNVVAVTDAGEVNSRPYVAMELVEGETMAEFLRRRARPSTIRRLEIAMELVDGLAHAHRYGVVHGDFRPANVMITVSGLVRILDFGFGRITSSAGLTNPHIPIAPFNYMSPEQITGRALTPQSDMFSLGAVLFELFSGQQAFPGTRSTRLLQRMLAGEHEPFLSLDADLPDETARVIERLLQPEASARFDSLTEVMLELAIARDRLIEEEARRAAEEAKETSAASSAVTFEASPVETIAIDEAIALHETAPSHEAAASDEDIAPYATAAADEPAAPGDTIPPDEMIAFHETAAFDATASDEPTRGPSPATSLGRGVAAWLAVDTEPVAVNGHTVTFVEPRPIVVVEQEAGDPSTAAPEPQPKPPREEPAREAFQPLPLEVTDAILRQLEDLNPRRTDLTDLLLEIDRLEEASRTRRSPGS